MRLLLDTHAALWFLLDDTDNGVAWRYEVKIKAEEAGGGKVDRTLHYERDAKMHGLGELIAMPAGEEVAKGDVADRLGYEGRRAWEKNKGAIMALLDGFFEEGSTNRVLRRKAGT